MDINIHDFKHHIQGMRDEARLKRQEAERLLARADEIINQVEIIESEFKPNLDSIQGVKK